MPRTGPPFLLVAHPGHELIVHGWLTATAARVFVLTDGSGREGTSRIPYSRALVEAAGGTCGTIFGRFTDRRLYGAIIAGERELFAELACELAEQIREAHPLCVVNDALEGYNPLHDLCRWIAGAAISMSWPVVPQFEFSTTDLARPLARGGFEQRLTPEALERKLAATRSHVPLQNEAESKVLIHGVQSLVREVFMPVERWDLVEELFEGRVAHYEILGAELVLRGTYREAIRFRQHMLPIRDRLVALLHACSLFEF
jgi:hypothetical protein